MPTHKIDNDGQVDENGVLDLTNFVSPTLDEVRLIRERVFSEMYLTEEQFNFYYDDLFGMLQYPSSTLIPGIKVISSSKTQHICGTPTK